MTGSFEITVHNSTEMECNENTCHCNAWRGGDLGRELIHCTVPTFLLEKYLKVFVNKYSQSPEGGGKPQGERGRAYKGGIYRLFFPFNG
jgi:hypothetical protein